MKKTILSVALSGCFLLAGIGTSSAEISREEMKLGGLSIGMNGTAISRIYGEPSQTEFGGFVWHYGDSVTINFQEGSLGSVTVTANNGWTTPAGLAVGMDVDSAMELYGEPDYSSKSGNQTLYVYFVNPYHPWGHMGILFDRDTKAITKINIFKSFMADFKDYFPNWEKQMFN